MTYYDIGDRVMTLPWYARKGSRLHKRTGVITGVLDEDRDVWYEVKWDGDDIVESDSPVEAHAVKRIRKKK